MTRSTFSVADDPWIPVIDATGAPGTQLVSLRDLFTNAHEYVHIGGLNWTPLSLSEFYRIAAAITYRITGLDTPHGTALDWDSAWAQTAAEGRFNTDAVDAYFTQYLDRWDLLSPTRPWLQDPRLPQQTNGAPSDLSQIVPQDPADGGPLLRGDVSAHHPRTMTPAEALPNLLATLGYHAGSPTAVRTVTTPDGTVLSSKYAGAAPNRGALSLHPTGTTVFATLMAHLVYPGLPGLPDLDTDASDLAPWEADVLPDPAAPMPAPTGVISMLAGRARRSYLLAATDDGLITGVYRAPAHLVRDTGTGLSGKVIKQDPDAHLLDPYLTYRTTKEGTLAPLLGDLAREPWRDLDSLLTVHDTPDTYRPSLIVVDGPARWADPAAVLGPITLTVLAADQDRAQDKERGAYTGMLPLPVTAALLTDPLLAGRLTTAATVYLAAADALVKALTRLKSDLNGRGGAFLNAGASGLLATYWQAATVRFSDQLAAYLTGAASPAQDAAALARHHYAHITRVHARDPRHAFAVAAGDHHLHTALTRLEDRP